MSTAARSAFPTAIMLLVDGIPQKFYPNDEQELTFMFPVLTGQDNINTDITFTPEIGASGGRADVLLVPYPMNTGLVNSYIRIHLENNASGSPEKTNPYPTLPLSAEIEDYLNNFGYEGFKDNYGISWEIKPAAEKEPSETGQIDEINLTEDSADWIFTAYTGMP
jgi:hypothetical protein